MLKGFLHKKDKSLNYLHGEGATSSVENAGISYQSASLLSAGANAEQVALLSTITNFVFAVLLIKVPSLIKFSDSLKRIVVALSIISALGWLPLILVPLFFTGISPSLLIILWVVSLVPDFMVGPLRDKWLSDLVPSGRIGRYLSLRTIISTGIYLGCFYMMGYMLDHFQGGIFNGFTFIFLFAFLGSLVSLVLYMVIKVPVPVGESAQADLGLFGFIREVKQNDLGIFIVFTTLLIFSASICGTFFSVYMLRDLQFTYLTFTLVISTEFVARIISSQFWGKLVDSKGAIKALRIASFMVPVIPVLWLFSSKVGYLMGVQTLSGIAWGAFDLCTQAYLCRASPPNKRLHYIIYHRTFVTLAAAGGPLLGAGLLNLIYPIFGNQILGIFLLSGVLRFLVIIALVPHLKGNDTVAQETGSEGTGYEQKLKPARVEIQPYNRRTQYPGPVKTTWRSLEFDNVHRANLKPIPVVIRKPSRPGLLYHPELWSQPRIAQGSAVRDIPPVRNSEMRTDTSPWKNEETGACARSGNSSKVSRLKDNLSRDIEYHKRWAAGVPCSSVSSVN